MSFTYRFSAEFELFYKIVMRTIYVDEVNDDFIGFVSCDWNKIDTMFTYMEAYYE